MITQIPGSWTKSTFGELNQFDSRAINPAQFPEEKFELYSVPSFPSKMPEYLKGSAIGSTKQIVEPNDVLICKINPRINRVWQVGVSQHLRQTASSEWIGFRSNILNTKFYRYFFSSTVFREQICADVTGVGGSLTRAQPKKVATFQVPVAPLSEQKRIADKLDAILARVDACRERLDRIPAILKRFRQSVLTAATSGKLTEEWRGISRIIRWITTPLANVCLSITDGDHQAPPQTETGIPFITISAINDGRLRLEKASRYVPSHYFEALKGNRRPQCGDILYSVTGSIGIPVLVDTDSAFTFQRHIAILKPDYSKITSNYLKYALGAENIQKQALIVATGTAQLTIPLTGLRAFLIEVPPIEEQTEIVRRVEALFAYADRLEARCAAARTKVDKLTPAILAKAFRGELVPQDPDDEPASVLLERIRQVQTKAKNQVKRRNSIVQPK